jgi:hypothetical protein
MTEKELTRIFKAIEPEQEAPEKLKQSLRSNVDTVVLSGKMIELFTVRMGEVLINMLGGKS